MTFADNQAIENPGQQFHSTSTQPITITFPSQKPLSPALKPKVEIGLTSTYITLYSIIFLMVYIQLWMIWFYRHKRFSYQTVFLYLALVWSGLRVTLFSFYFKDITRVNFFPILPYWLLFCFPVCLQFTILTLLVLFFAQVVFKARARFEPSVIKLPLKISLVVAVCIFLGTNISCAVISKKYEGASLPVTMLYIRVAINDTLFIIMSFILSFCIYRLAKMASASVVLEAKGTTMCQAITACVLIVLLYLSRAIYNIIAVCPRNRKLPGFGYDWINVTDQADFVHLDEGLAFVSFGAVLFVWEILPMFVVILFFRVKKPGSASSSHDLPSHNHSRNAYFFDNPRRYDSEEDLSIRSDFTNSAHSINQSNYSINASDEHARDSPYGTPQVQQRLDSPHATPTRPHKLGYGAVMASQGSPNISVHSPSHTGYMQKD